LLGLTFRGAASNRVRGEYSSLLAQSNDHL